MEGIDVYQERYLAHQKRKLLMLSKRKETYTDQEIDSFLMILRNRRSQRVFNEQPIGMIDIIGICQAIDLAPSSCDRRAITVTLVNDKERKDKLSEFLVGGRDWLQNADTILLLLADMIAYKSPAEVDYMPYLDAGVIVENIYLAGEALGIGVCFVNPNVRKSDLEAFNKLFVDKGFRFCGAVALGYY